MSFNIRLGFAIYFIHVHVYYDAHSITSIKHVVKFYKTIGC